MVLFLLSVKVVVFAGFWLAYAYESAGDARLEDHVVVTPLDLRKGDESSIELREHVPHASQAHRGGVDGVVATAHVVSLA